MRQNHHLPAVVCLFLAASRLATSLHAEAPCALPEGQLSNDARLGELTHVNSFFPMTVPKTKSGWNERAEYLRRQLAVSQGVWPQPTKTPLNAVVHGAVERDGYTVERVYFESLPGHFVTGSLYRPKGKSGQLPVVLCPHGHWNEGRFHKENEQGIKKQIVAGAERFELSGRYPLQARCVTLARMGCVVFHYDMVGYADSRQIVHRPGPRPEMNTDERGGNSDWGFFSPLAELHLQTFMGLQTWNSIRALDFVTSLPYVDPTRIGVTGASGGGTQTFILCALDPRPAVAFPAVMVGTAMQGGCTCENSALLRVDTGNIELAALIAPRPLGMTGADDWTKEIETKGLPELKEVYALLGKKDNVFAKSLTQFPHNYNYVSRAVMYGWMNKHLKLGLKEPVIEEDFTPLSEAEMTVWDDAHPAPAKGPEQERNWLRWMTRDTAEQLVPLAQKDSAKYREIVGGAWDVILGRRIGDVHDLELIGSTSRNRDDFSETVGRLAFKAKKEELPVIVLRPAKDARHVTVWLDGSGKSSLYATDGSLRPEVKRLLAAGHTVISGDLLFQGEFLADGKPLTAQRMVDSKQSYGSTAACYTFGYNRALFAQRVHDALSLIEFGRSQAHDKTHVNLIGVNGAGVIAAAAALQSGDTIAHLALDTQGFAFNKLTSTSDINFLPGAAKYGDVSALLALRAPHDLWVAGESGGTKLVHGMFGAAGKTNALTVADAKSPEAPAKAVEWLIK